MYTEKQIKEAWSIANKLGIKYFGSVGSNAKTIKSDKSTNYLTHIMYLAPSNQSGYNTCPMASKGCAEACLFTAGHGAMQVVKDARIRRTRLYFEDRETFKICVFDELQKHAEVCKKQKKIPAVRLNGTSDIVWEKIWPELFTHFKGTQFYDYTKIYQRLMPGYKLPKNYYLILSRSESNDNHINEVMKANPKANVAAVFDVLPKEWRGRKVIDGDLMDLRVLDPKGVIVGLKHKGEAKKDKSGFVIKTQDVTVKGLRIISPIFTNKTEAVR